ncbi:MAG: lycopene cyclase family protein [Planctomycetota bacterium]
MKTEQVDLAILGGGCAGLSLATRLAQAENAPRTVVLEARSAYTADRTWCYWEPLRHPFEHLVTHRWPRWGLRRPDGRAVTLDADAHPYCQLDSEAFYGFAAAAINSSDSVRLQLSSPVATVECSGAAVRIRAGESEWSAKRVIDTRPDGRRMAKARLLQHFVGWEVELAADALDPERALLMDFAVRQDRGLHFMYLLPNSSRRALVESTYFSRTPLETAHYEDDLRRYLSSLAGETPFRILRREQGVLPMDTGPPTPSAGERHAYGGIAGGALRPATGYAFHNIQAWADRLGAELTGAREPRHVATPRVLGPMDAIFLAFLRERPDLAPAAFAALFERVGADSLARFLSDRPSWSDLWAVVRALPVAPLASAGLRVLRGVA